MNNIDQEEDFEIKREYFGNGVLKYEYLTKSIVSIHRHYWPNGDLERETYFQGGKIHREDGPAIVSYHSNGQKDRECYTVKGVKHRNGLPAELYYYEDGRIKSEEYIHEGVRHRDSKQGPAYIVYNPDENLPPLYINYCEKDTEHRMDGPSHIAHYRDGTKCSVLFKRHGKFHNDDGPAEIYFYANGQVKEVCYYLNGLKHNSADYAHVKYNDLGEVTLKSKFVNGNYVDEKSALVLPRKLDYLFSFRIPYAICHTRGNWHVVWEPATWVTPGLPTIR